jgi:hypothetical protein
VVTRNTSEGTSLALPTVNITGFTDQMKAAITKADATPVPLQGVSFDTAGNLLGDAKARLSSLGTMLNDNSTLKATITTYGESIEEATSRANAIKSSLTRAGISTERITTQPELGAGLPTISFSK